MKSKRYWADDYVNKKRTAQQAIQMIKPGKRVYIGFATGCPQALVSELRESAFRFTGLEIVRLMSHEASSLTDIANRTHDLSLNIRTIYLGSAGSESIAENMRFITPMNMSEVPGLFKSRKLPINVALIHVSPPDDFGWLSLGVSVDITLAAALSADFVIAQVNSNMPRVQGQSFIHVNDVDVIVEHDEPMLTNHSSAPGEAISQIGRHIARLIEDGSTLQIGLDAASQATLQALSHKNDLGIHSQFITDDIMHLFAQGVVTNRKKRLNEGKLVGSSAIGSELLYEFLNDNPAVDFRPSDYVNDPLVISQHYRMVSMNVANSIDLTGQISAEASPETLLAGVSGIPDFVRGAKRSHGGKAILMLPSTTPDGKKSNIVPSISDVAVVVPRGDVHYVVTEYGAINLFGKSLQERVVAMISLAHPDFRDELFQAAKEMRLISKERSLGEAIRGIYPLKREETFTIKDHEITVRPAKPVDERRIQEHYYDLDKDDVLLRFFHEKNTFGRNDVEVRSQVDYIKDMTFVGIVGEFGFGKVVAVGEYMMMPKSNIAEVAFSVSKEYRGLGLGKILLRKLAETALENGIAGLVAYTYPQNQAMTRLFKSLPYKVSTRFDGETICLKCRFDEMAENGN